MALSRVGITGLNKENGSSVIKQVSGARANTQTTTPTGSNTTGQVDGDTSTDTDGTVNGGEVAEDEGGTATTTTSSTSTTPVEKALSLNDRILDTLNKQSAANQSIDPSMFQQKDPMADMLPMLLAGRQQQPQSSPQSSPRQSESQRSSGTEAMKGMQEQFAKMQADNQKFQKSMFAELKTAVNGAKKPDTEMAQKLADLNPVTKPSVSTPKPEEQAKSEPKATASTYGLSSFATGMADFIADPAGTFLNAVGLNPLSGESKQEQASFDNKSKPDTGVEYPQDLDATNQSSTEQYTASVIEVPEPEEPVS